MKKFKENPTMQKIAVVIGLGLITLTYIYTTTRPPKEDTKIFVSEQDTVYANTGYSAENTDANIVPIKTEAENTSDLSPEEAVDVLYENNRYIVDTFILNHLGADETQKIQAPYYQTKNKDFAKIDKIEAVMKNTYTTSYVDTILLSYEQPMYFETDNIVYYNEMVKIDAQNIDWATNTKEINKIDDNTYEIIVHTRKIIEEGKTEDITISVNMVKEDNGWRFVSLLT